MGRRTKQDPTGQAAARREAYARLARRLTEAQRAVVGLFKRIRYERRLETVLINATIPVYDYQITNQELIELEAAIRTVVNAAVMETQFNRMPPNWWWQEALEPPYREGMAAEIVEFNQLVAAELVRTRTRQGLAPQRLEIGAVLQSPEYQTALQNVYLRNFRELKGLSDDVSVQAMGVISRGIAAKTPPADVTASIVERFDVSRSRAKRIVDSEVNQAYNDARLDATDVAAGLTGLRAGVLHLSALIPTTREGHAARHGNAYTTDQQRRWWDSDANRINCHCSTRSVLIDAAGNVIDVELQQEIQAERKEFDR